MVERLKIPACRMVQAAWADGDSFLIETNQGVQHTIRLYGVDCIEVEATDDTDARRLRARGSTLGSQTRVVLHKHRLNLRKSMANSPLPRQRAC